MAKQMVPTSLVNDTTTPVDEDGDPIMLSDDEGEEDDVGEIQSTTKHRLTFEIWNGTKKMKVNGEWKAKCIWC